MAIKKQEVTVTIPKPDFKEMKIRITGKTPLIFHKWSEKAKKQIRDKQMMKAKESKQPRNPEEEYINSFYYDSNGNIAFPALAIKQALIGAARSVDGLTMTELRGSIFPIGDADGLVPVLVNNKPVKPAEINIEGPFPENIFGIDKQTPEINMREDQVTIGMGSADLRYRGQVKNWEMVFIVSYLGNKLSAEQVLNLFQYAGFSSGLGEWRPEKSGLSGCFEINSSA